jgi:helicase
VERAFRDGVIKILSATPTLAAGVNLPARTVILSSYERYEPGYGRYLISVLEYKQISGRAGRPKYDKYGEAILTARSHDELEFLMEKYVTSKPEKLWSKLAAEKVLRPHVLSTIAMRFANSEEGLNDFFSQTFFAHQYGDGAIKSKLEGILKFLFKEGLIEVEGRRIKATRFGARVSELYIDPESAVVIRDGLLRGAESISELSFIHLVTRTPDLSPKMHPRRREKEELSMVVEEHRNEFFIDVPDPFSDFYDYEAFLAEVKTSKILLDWMNELPEDGILKRYGAEPGDLLRLVELADWLLYAVEGLAPLFNRDKYRAHLERLRVRVSAGVKEELVPLVQLKGIGRVRARSLYNYGLRSISDLKKASVSELISVPMIGPEVTRKIKEQVGGKVSREDWERLKKAGGAGEQRLISEYRI